MSNKDSGGKRERPVPVRPPRPDEPEYGQKPDVTSPRGQPEKKRASVDLGKRTSATSQASVSGRPNPPARAPTAPISSAIVSGEPTPTGRPPVRPVAPPRRPKGDEVKQVASPASEAVNRNASTNTVARGRSDSMAPPEEPAPPPPPPSRKATSAQDHLDPVKAFNRTRPLPQLPRTTPGSSSTASAPGAANSGRRVSDLSPDQQEKFREWQRLRRQAKETQVKDESSESTDLSTDSVKISKNKF